ncbi:hypothetical protein AAG570_001579 [Ranatra chinensis]|uniref:Uncharacterized protein n=1 Tax=Ranatra chinensis TaxID=642074 RepID=A0ABD0YRJ3_9HEMI
MVSKRRNMFYPEQEAGDDGNRYKRRNMFCQNKKQETTEIDGRWDNLQFVCLDGRWDNLQWLFGLVCCRALGFLRHFLGLAELFGLVLQVSERAVHAAGDINPGNKVVIFSAFVCWFLALVWPIFPLFGIGKVSCDLTCVSCGMDWSPLRGVQFWYNTAYMTAAIGLPVAVMYGSHLGRSDRSDMNYYPDSTAEDWPKPVLTNGLRARDDRSGLALSCDISFAAEDGGYPKPVRIIELRARDDIVTSLYGCLLYIWTSNSPVQTQKHAEEKRTTHAVTTSVMLWMFFNVPSALVTLMIVFRFESSISPVIVILAHISPEVGSSMLVVCFLCLDTSLREALICPTPVSQVQPFAINKIKNRRHKPIPFTNACCCC